MPVTPAPFLLHWLAPLLRCRPTPSRKKADQWRRRRLHTQNSLSPRRCPMTPWLPIGAPGEPYISWRACSDPKLCRSPGGTPVVRANQPQQQICLRSSSTAATSTSLHLPELLPATANAIPYHTPSCARHPGDEPIPELPPMLLFGFTTSHDRQVPHLLLPRLQYSILPLCICGVPRSR